MKRHWLSVAVLLLVPRTLPAGTVLIDFESFADGDTLTNQITGLTFTNTVVLTAGFSLNEIDFPPRSGVNVVSDSGGPINISFATPIFGFTAYFTYIEPLSLSAFNGSSAQVDSALSMFSNNTSTGGDQGSSPNELLNVSSLAGISSVSITGDPAGGSFVMDDVALATAVPEPRLPWLVLSASGLFAFFLRQRLAT